MKKYQQIILFLFIISALGFGQELKKNKYGLFVIDNAQSYKELAVKDSNNLLVDIKKFIPTIKLDIRYSTKNNFLGEPVYNSARAFLRLPAAIALKHIQKELSIIGLGLKIFDAYRPYGATVKFYDKVKDTMYVASAYSGSRHNRGCAVDLTLISLKTSKPLDMPTGFDSFLEKAHSDYLKLPPSEIKNRDLLIGVMAKYGFINLDSEWWHYDFKDWKKFDLMDLSFDQLDKINSETHFK